MHRPDLSVRPLQPFQGRADVTAAFADGFHPFWFWNDRITPETIRAQAGCMHDQGIRGFFIHSRQGLAQPYMSAGSLELFMKTFEAQVASWCRAHHLRYSGEKPSVRLRQLAVMDVPGCEPGHAKAGAARSDLLQEDTRGNARSTASAAYFYGKEGSLCECFHSLGWGTTLQDAKIISESLIAFGTRWLVPHAFFYSTRGLRKHDAPPSFLQMPYWPLFGELTRRVEELARHSMGQ